MSSGPATTWTNPSPACSVRSSPNAESSVASAAAGVSTLTSESRSSTGSIAIELTLRPMAPASPERRQAWTTRSWPSSTNPWASSSDPLDAEPATVYPVSASKIARSQSPGPPSRRASISPSAGAVRVVASTAAESSSRSVQSRSAVEAAVRVSSRTSPAPAAGAHARLSAADAAPIAIRVLEPIVISNWSAPLPLCVPGSNRRATRCAHPSPARGPRSSDTPAASGARGEDVEQAVGVAGEERRADAPNALELRPRCPGAAPRSRAASSRGRPCRRAFRRRRPGATPAAPGRGPRPRARGRSARRRSALALARGRGSGSSRGPEARPRDRRRRSSAPSGARRDPVAEVVEQRPSATRLREGEGLDRPKRAPAAVARRPGTPGRGSRAWGVRQGRSRRRPPGAGSTLRAPAALGDREPDAASPSSRGLSITSSASGPASAPRRSM